MRPDRGLAALCLAASLGLAAPAAATAQTLVALASHDVALYQTALAAAQRGDDDGADQALAQVSDPCLVGMVQYEELIHGKARTVSYDDLTAWLKANADLPVAVDVYQMAQQRRPADAPTPPSISASAAGDWSWGATPAPHSHAAREAFFEGDVAHAYQLARASGDAWIAGLAAYRLGDFTDSLIAFEALAANPAESDRTRAAAGVWGARAATAAGRPERVTPLLEIAAAAPRTFYGMIARRKLQLADDPLGALVDAAIHGSPMPPAGAAGSPAAGDSALDALVRTDRRAHRAVALMQLQRPLDAAAELDAGVASAADDATRELWIGLRFELDPRPNGPVARAVTLANTATDYPTPRLLPTGGFTIDKSLVYAITWQESRFNGLAVSRVGAVGLMQLMPHSAAYVSGDPSLATNPIPLYDTGKNLALGQSYVTWLEENASDYDILRTIAAYNAGPTALARTEDLVGPEADSLMVVECMPAAETRDYVKKVMAAYWSYRRQFGEHSRTLDALASDKRSIDIRLDRSTPVQNPQPTSTAAAREALDILLRSSG